MFLHKPLYLKERVAHPYAQSLSLIAACNGTAVIARKNDDRPVLQVRAKYPLAGHKEIIAVGKGKHNYILLII